jgi:hypothetical protein
MASGARYYVYLWTGATMTALLCRLLGPRSWGIFVALRTPARIIPFNIVLFWVILIAAVGLTVAKLIGRIH